MFLKKMFFNFLFVCLVTELTCSSIEDHPNYQGDEKKIEMLDREIKKNEQIEMEKMVHSRDYMIADWPKYSSEIQEIRQLELNDKEKEKEIKTINHL